MSQWQYVTTTADVPVREGRRVRVGELELALFNLGDRYLAVDNACPHRRGPLADGIVAGASVFCPLHAWKIALETGCVESGGEGQVNTYPVRVVDHKIYITLDRLQPTPVAK